MRAPWATALLGLTLLTSWQGPPASSPAHAQRYATTRPSVFVVAAATATATAAAAPPSTSASSTAAQRRSLWEFSVVWDKLGRLFARFDPRSNGRRRKCDADKKADKDEDDEDVHPSAYRHRQHHDTDPRTHPGLPGDGDANSHLVPLAGNDPLVFAPNTSTTTTTTATNEMQPLLTATDTNDTTTTGIPVIKGLLRRRRLVDGQDAAVKTAASSEDDRSQAVDMRRVLSALVQLVRTEELTRHERLYAMPVNDDANDRMTSTMGAPPAHEPQLVGESFDHLYHWDTFLQPVGGPSGGMEEEKKNEPSAKQANLESMTQQRPWEEDKTHPAGRRYLLLHHLHRDHHHHHDDDDDDTNSREDSHHDGGLGEEDIEDYGPYYTKDSGDWYWHTHQQQHHEQRPKSNVVSGHRRRSLQEAEAVEQGGRMIDVSEANPNLTRPKQPSPEALRNMTEAEMQALEERNREALVNLLRQAAREEEAKRTEPHVSASLDSVLAALAVAPPPGLGTDNGDDDDDGGGGDNDNVRRVLQEEAAAAAGNGRGAALVSALASSLTEQQKAEIRQVVYDAAMTMIREAAREALSSDGKGDGNGGGQLAAAAQKASNRLRSGDAAVSNPDAYAAAANAVVNALAPGRGTNGQGPLSSVGPAVDTGRGKSLLEAAREAARQSKSAGRAPATYNPYPPRNRRLRGSGKSDLRQLKDTSFRIPVPFTRDPASNASSPKLRFNSSDAVYVPLRQQQQQLDQHQEKQETTANSFPWPRIGSIGPVIAGSQGAIGGPNADGNPGDSKKKKKKQQAHHHWADELLHLVHQQKRHHQHQHQHQHHHNHPPSHAKQQREQPPRRLEAVTPATSSDDKAAPAPTPAPAPADAKAAGLPPPPADATTGATTAAAPSSQPAPHDMSTGDFLQNGGPAGGSGVANGNGLNLNALADLLQKPFVPPVPGSMGTRPNDQPAQGQTDAYGNAKTDKAAAAATTTTSMRAGEEEQEQQQQEEEEGYTYQAEEEDGGGDKQQRENEQEAEEDEDGMFGKAGRGMGDAFYDRASTDLMAHSGRNFKKMQAAVSQILAEEGFDV